ncbi:DUF3574 domain-containing protein [Saccharopolyspora sp. NPDC003752]
MIKSPVRLTAAVLAAGLIGVGGPVAYGALGDGAPSERAGAAYLETSLFFGTAIPGGGEPVSDEQFHAFVDEVVTPQFPAGLTVQDGYGQYRDAHGVIEREKSFELVLLYPVAEHGANDPKIEGIREEYKKRFAQESVARVDDRTAVDF